MKNIEQIKKIFFKNIKLQEKKPTNKKINKSINQD